MRNPTPEQMDTAAKWLDHCAAMDANDDDRETLLVVAAWLQAQSERAAMKYIAKTAGVTVRDVRRFIKLKAEKEAANAG